MDKYMEYLKRLTQNTDMGLWQAHQLALSREAAKEYGVTDEELIWLDENL